MHFRHPHGLQIFRIPVAPHNLIERSDAGPSHPGTQTATLKKRSVRRAPCIRILEKCVRWATTRNYNKRA